MTQVIKSNDSSIHYPAALQAGCFDGLLPGVCPVEIPGHPVHCQALGEPHTTFQEHLCNMSHNVFY